MEKLENHSPQRYSRHGNKSFLIGNEVQLAGAMNGHGGKRPPRGGESVFTLKQILSAVCIFPTEL
ncbi:MAG: hypothetical protein LBE85_08295 [Candidatus Accumulibacter sp.]|jgi:hypothetical protein|nr:hypothetical protein [Accumulibacter sp.]